ncbi:hypothetical protein [Chromobacterium sp. ATCC 53434]|nr:hypothetical protein [Chromobacterium sp. ATCC 53434]
MRSREHQEKDNEEVNHVGSGERKVVVVAAMNSCLDDEDAAMFAGAK